MLRKNYHDEFRENLLLLLSFGIVAVVMIVLFESAKHLKISSVALPEQKEQQKSISIVMASVAPAPKVTKKVVEPRKQPPKPVVKKEVKKIEKKVSKPIVKKPALTKVVKEEVVKEEVVQEQEVQKELVAQEAQPSEVKKVLDEPVKEVAVAQTTPQKVTTESQKSVKEVSTVVNAELKEEYIAGLYKLLSQQKRYPKMAKRRGLEGVAHIHFTVLKNGNLDNVYIAKACGHKSLDKAALKLVKSVKKYMPIPDEVSRVAMNLKIPITYSLREGY